MNNRIDTAIGQLIKKVRVHYGARLGAIYLVDRSSEIEELDRSDAEIVVLLADGNWRALDEQRALGTLTFDTLMDHDVHIRAWPVAISSWSNPESSAHPGLVREFRAFARELQVAA